MTSEPNLSKEAAAEWAKQIGLEVSDAELDELLPLIQFQLDQGKVLRSLEVDSTVEPDAVFLADGEY